MTGFIHPYLRITNNPQWHSQLYILAAMLRHAKHISPLNEKVYKRPEFKKGWKAIEDVILNPEHTSEA